MRLHLRLLDLLKGIHFKGSRQILFFNKAFFKVIASLLPKKITQLKQNLAAYSNLLCLLTSLWLLFAFALASRAVQAQNFGLQTKIGFSIANHPDFPPSQAPTLGIELSLSPTVSDKKKASPRAWQHWYRRSQLYFAAHYQTTGNAEVLGKAFALVPTMRFTLNKPNQRLQTTFAMGWGLAYLSRHYNFFTNPTNIVIGAPINACATAAFQTKFQFSAHWAAAAELGVVHYSNAGTATPNLGLNIPYFGLSLGYNLADFRSDSITPKPDRTTLQPYFRPFAQSGIGITAKGQGNAKYPVYLASVGVSRAFSRISLLSLSLEYVYNMATAEFYRYNGGAAVSSRQIQRFCLTAQHEFLFGHWAFATAGGIYIGRHIDQRSIFATKVGLIYYPRNVFVPHRHQIWLAAYIRAYFGEAEALEFQLGYRF
jgi:hypothetical protein